MALKRAGDGCPNHLLVVELELQPQLIRGGACVVDAEVAAHAAAQTIGGEPDGSHSRGPLSSEVCIDVARREHGEHERETCAWRLNLAAALPVNSAGESS